MNRTKKSMQLWAILSLSMINAFVGTGISPALSSIKEYFYDAPAILVQMIVSLPSLLVIAVAFVFPWLSKRVSMRKLCLLGIFLFTAGGLAGGITNQIGTMIFTRTIIGLGYGLMMPLSVGLLAYFYDSAEQHRLNGEIVIWSSVSSIVCMMLAGYLVVISWRYVFLVYLSGIPCLWLCFKFIPDVTLNSPKNRISLSIVKKTLPYSVGIFVIFTAYFAILNNCSNISVSEGTVAAAHIGTVMTIQTFSSLFTGKCVETLKRIFKGSTGCMIWIFAIGGLFSLCVPQSLLFLCLGLLLFGIALALAVGTLNAEACIACEKDESLSAGTLIMFMRSLGQFSSPITLAFLAQAVGSGNVRFPYLGAAAMCGVMLICFLVMGKRAHTA